MCGIKESIRLKGEIKNDTRLGGCVELAEVGVLRHIAFLSPYILHCTWCTSPL
jgi:hypothetical protein